MSLKDGLLNVIKPIVASYSTPRGSLAGIASLMGSPALGAAIRYGPELGKMLGALSSQSGTQQEFGGMSGMMPVGLARAGRGAGGGSDIELSNLAQYLQRQRGMEGVPQMNQGGLVQQVIADRQRVLDSFTPNPYDQYQYLMENPATRQAPVDDEVVPDVTGGVMPADTTPAPVLGADDPRANLNDRIAQLMDPNRQGLTREEALEQQLRSISKGYDINNDGVVTNAEFQMSMNPEFTGVESRIQELMDSGMTRLEALAKQSYGIQQGYDLNNDGMVTDAEYAEFMRAQEPTVSIMPVPNTGEPTLPSKVGLDSFSSMFNSEGIQQAIDEYKASMADRFGGVDAPATTPTTPTIPENLQDRIAALTGGAGTFGGMIPNIDVDRLREVMAELYGGRMTTPTMGTSDPNAGRLSFDDFNRREPMPRPLGGRRIISDPRRFTAIPPMNLPDSGGMGARIPSSRK